jgi:selenide,water dikinase
MEKIKLTQYSKGSGCGCKIAPDQLSSILKTNSDEIADINLIVGNKNNDDAAVYKINDTTAIISTTDFFTPIVDDPFDFGRIAACNAISDVYAMGGKPITAIGILGWPIDKIPTTYAQQVLEGARHMCTEAGISLSGGHSIENSEPIFGLAVTGIAELNCIKRNNNPQAGDHLFLSKPLGLGILSAALKRGTIKADDEKVMINIMTSLNKLGNAISHIDGVNAMTDVTGFGLIGHLTEMTKGANVSAILNLKDIPLIREIDFYTQQFCYPDITTKNLNAYKNTTEGLNGLEFLLLCDPQTSGGLLISVNENAMAEFLEICKAFDHFNCLSKPIGRFISQEDKMIYIHQ